MKYAVVTLCIGSSYDEIAKLTHPTIKKYASRIGADFILLDQEENYGVNVPIGYQKFQMVKLLETYDRIIFLDSDLIVRDDCPNLFQFVPDGWFGAFNEGEWMERKSSLDQAVGDFGLPLINKKEWGNRYFNTGVMVFEKMHKDIFKLPTIFHNNFYEQTYLNLMINRNIKIDLIKNIGPQFNRMSHVDKETYHNRFEEYIIHYAGTMSGSGWAHEIPQGKCLVDLIKHDLHVWGQMKDSAVGYHVPRKYLVSIGGGLGDQIDSEPVLREIRRLYPKDYLIVNSHWPELFEDLPYEIQENHNMKDYTGDLGIVHKFHTYAGPDQSDAWKYMTHVMMNSTDFSSLLCTRRPLPIDKKQIMLRYREDQKKAMLDKLNVTVEWLKNAVVLHPGMSWRTKTISPQVWEEIIADMSLQGKNIVIMGKSDSNYQGPKRGADKIGLVDIEIPNNVIDARDKLSVKESLALLDSCKILVSNDSAPIHLAGATDIWILYIATAKHPEFILPYRKGSQSYKTVECNLRPSCWPCNVNALTTRPSECRADHCLNFEKQYACHPTSELILKKLNKIFDGD